MKRLAALLFLVSGIAMGQSQPYVTWANSYVTWNSGIAASFYSVLQNNGVAVPQEPALNFIPGSNITFTFADNPGTGVTSLTIASSGSAGALLSATDAVNTAPVRGGVIVSNSTPKWAQVAVGANGTIFASNGTDPSWTSEAVTAPITNTTGNIGISITTTNDGGAVVKQAATPGTQQGSGGNANINTNGTWIEELDALAATATNGITAQNVTASTSGTPQQVSPNLNICGTGWNGAASETDCYRLQMLPNSGSSGSTFRVLSSVAGGANTVPLTLNNAGTLTIGASFTMNGGLTDNAANSLIAINGNTNGNGGFQYNLTQGGVGLDTGQTQAMSGFSGATATSTGTLLPAGSVILAVTYRITTTITGATGFQVGDGSVATRFCGTQSTLTAGTTGICLNAVNCGNTTCTATNGMAQAAAGNIVFTSTGSNFTAGAVRVQVYYKTFTPPTS